MRFDTRQFNALSLVLALGCFGCSSTAGTETDAESTTQKILQTASTTLRDANGGFVGRVVFAAVGGAGSCLRIA